MEWAANARKSHFELGFVPTMGALHQGHIDLAKRAKAKNDLLVCSIFVNPIQFNNPEDLKKYPRDLERDLQRLQTIDCDAVFCPDEEEIYPEPVTTKYDFGHVDKVMEGKYRQGHFNGVAIVVNKLFDIVQPHRAYFGEKDFQQLQIIKALVKKEKKEVEVIACPTVRESDGLAMSSRNARLNPLQRKEAAKIFETLEGAKKRFGFMSPRAIKKWVEQEINASSELKLEYFEIVDAENLLPLEKTDPDFPVVGCIAVNAGEVRLIDNIFLNV